MEKIFALLLLLNPLFILGQNAQTTALNVGHDGIRIDKTSNLALPVLLEKGALYQFFVLQQGIDVMLVLSDQSGKQILEKDSPNGQNGFEIFEYSASETGVYSLAVKRLEEEGNSDKGQISYYIKKFSKQEIAIREKTEKDLIFENQKNVLTLDIDHFWEAFDHLSSCKTQWDSILAIQNLYLDRATNGLKEFIKKRNFSADVFISTIRKYPKYYLSVRPYTFEAHKCEPQIQQVFDTFKALYAHFKPFQVCFAMGVHQTAGTASDHFILIGTEMNTIGKNVDFSELGEDWKPGAMTEEPDIPQKIKGIIAHECVHTQQAERLDSNAIECNQLYFCLREGAANFVGELLTGATNYSSVNEYGDKHENNLWNEFKAGMCSQTAENWLYNGNTVKGRPADLGYYIGYKITEAYYHRAKDKKEAVKEIIELNDPISFLQKSGYDQQKKKG